MSPHPSRVAFVRQRLPGGIAIARAQFLSAVKAPGFYDLAMKRYKEGEREHAGEPSWETWPSYRFEAEALEEIVDACLYPTMGLVAQDIRDASGAMPPR